MMFLLTILLLLLAVDSKVQAATPPNVKTRRNLRFRNPEDDYPQPTKDSHPSPSLPFLTPTGPSRPIVVLPTQDPFYTEGFIEAFLPTSSPTAEPKAAM